MVRLESTVRKIIKPILAEQGYWYDNYLMFRKNMEDKTYIISFQKGKGSITGQFTVNLALYTPETYEGFEDPPSLVNAKDFDCKCEWRERLGSITETWFSRLALKLFGPRDKWWKDIFAPKEKWWKTPAFEDDAEILLKNIGTEIIHEGIPWLEKIKTTK
jgi:hypothetical protein